MLLVRPFFMGFCLWLAAWMGAAPTMAAAVSCEDWNTTGFFKRAGVADISCCLKMKDPNARDEGGLTPLHWAALENTTPAVVAALLDAGADPAGRDKADSPPKGTDVYRRLNEARGSRPHRSGMP